MKKILSTFILLICLVVASISIAADSYLCVADKSVGFRYNEQSKKWVEAIFDVTDVKYIITTSEPLIDNEKISNRAWAIKNLGDEYPFAYSNENFSNNDSIIIKAGYEFFIDKKSLRYLKVYNQGYWSGKDNNKDTPYLEIGKCSPL